MWVPESESREQILDLYARAIAAAENTVDALPLDAPGQVMWWPEDRCQVTLGQILVHVLNEVARHAGHADIVRELIDGQVGRYAGDPSLGSLDSSERAARCARIEEAARAATKDGQPATSR